MDKLVIGLFDNRHEAETVIGELEDAGFSRRHIGFLSLSHQFQGADISGASMSTDRTEIGGYPADTMAGSEVEPGAPVSARGAGRDDQILDLDLKEHEISGLGRVLTAGQFDDMLGGFGNEDRNLLRILTDHGVPTDDANYYAEGVRRGDCLVSVEADDDDAMRAADIMRQHGVIDLDRKADYYRSTGFQNYDETATPYSADQIRKDREDFGRYGSTEKTIPVVEEDVRIGKRKVSGGGARIFTRVSERPVEESVTLREEHVSVDREKVDRPLRGEDMDAFKDGEILVSESREEPVVSKEARVVEEVHVRKDVEEHEEQVRDSVRRTDVEVERLGKNPRP